MLRIKMIIAMFMVALIINCTTFIVFANDDNGIKDQLIIEDQTITPTPGGPEVTTILEKQELTMTFTGDLALGTNLGAYNRFDNLYRTKGAEYFLKKLQGIIGKDDATIANLESVFTTKTSFLKGKIYTYKANPKYISILKKGSIEYVSIVNNHMQDYKQEGFNQSIKTLNKEGIKWFGYARKDPSTGEIGGVKVNKIEYIEKNRIKVGLLSYYGFNAQSVNGKKIKRDVEKAKSHGAQYIVASLHAGACNTTALEAKQVSMAHNLINNGVDLVIGNHPHVIQNIEKYKGKFIYYSLGNFLFVDYGGSKNDEGLLVQVKLKRNLDSGEITSELRNIVISWTGGTVVNKHTPTLIKSKMILRKVNSTLGLEN